MSSVTSFWLSSRERVKKVFPISSTRGTVYKDLIYFFQFFTAVALSGGTTRVRGKERPGGERRKKYVVRIELTKPSVFGYDGFHEMPDSRNPAGLLLPGVPGKHAVRAQGSNRSREWQTGRASEGQREEESKERSEMIYKRKGHWHLDVTIHGIRYREALDTTDKREAKDLEKDRIAAIKQGKGA